MKSTVVRFSFTVVLAGAPLVLSAQVFGNSRSNSTGSLTLLTGPHLLSTPNMGITRSDISAGPALSAWSPPPTLSETLTFGEYDQSASRVEKVTEEELKEARHKYEEAKARLEKLEAERAAVLAQKKNSAGWLVLRPSRAIPPAQDPLRFDAQLVPPTTDLRKPMFNGAVRFTPEQKAGPAPVSPDAAPRTSPPPPPH